MEDLFDEDDAGRTYLEDGVGPAIDEQVTGRFQRWRQKTHEKDGIFEQLRNEIRERWNNTINSSMIEKETRIRERLDAWKQVTNDLGLIVEDGITEDGELNITLSCWPILQLLYGANRNSSYEINEQFYNDYDWAPLDFMINIIAAYIVFGEGLESIFYSFQADQKGKIRNYRRFLAAIDFVTENIYPHTYEDIIKLKDDRFARILSLSNIEPTIKYYTVQKSDLDTREWERIIPKE